MTNPYFTVIVPTYNRAKLIPATLSTVQRQTYPDFEVIVIDNGSTDETDTIMEDFLKDSRFQYIRSEENNERAWSRNRGLAVAKGTYVTFLDSDDFMYESCLEDAFNYSKTKPEFHFFHNFYELVDENQNSIYKFRFPSLQNQYKALASGNFISCIGAFIHRSIYLNLRFNLDPKMIGAEDYEIWFDVLAKHKIGRIEKINSGIRDHGGRSVNNGVYSNLDHQERQLINKIRSSDLLTARFGRYLPRLRANFSLHKAIAENKNGNKKNALRQLAHAAEQDPTAFLTRRAMGVIYNILKF